MIDKTHALPLTRQAELLDISRGSIYYRAVPVPDIDLRVMREIDELHLDYPFAGARMLKGFLKKKGFTIGRRHIARLMRLMGIAALYRRKQSTTRNPAHPIHPYLLRNLAIERPNQVWAADITYIPMQRGFLYLFAVIDWHSRAILSWRLSNSLTTDFCVDAVEAAISEHGTPTIFNTDQGCQFTSFDFTDMLTSNGIAISMDGRGAWRDNVVIERFWRSLKYEEVYLRAYGSATEPKLRIGAYIEFYNTFRPHSSLDGETPAEVYFKQPQQRAA
jgi:putative transposase